MDPKLLAITLAETLPEEGSPRDELIALGMVATAVINTIQPEQRAAAVRQFCDTLQACHKSDLN